MGVTKTQNFSGEQNRLAEFFKAMGHPARIAILQHLLTAPCCICKDFTSELQLAQPTVSRHLKELKQVGLICGEIEGTSVQYCLNPLLRKDISGLLGLLPKGEEF